MQTELPRYTLAQASYMPRNNSVSQTHEYLQAGTEIVHTGFPGPHWTPLNAPAQKAVAEAKAKRPKATLDPTRELPNGIDPMMGVTLESALLSVLRRAEAEVGSKPATEDKLDKLTDAITGLVQALAVPAKGRN